MNMAVSKNKCFLNLAKKFAQGLYFFIKLLPTQNKAVLITRLNRQTSVDFQLLIEEIGQRHPKTRTVILNHRRNNIFRQALDILSEMYHLATSQVAVIDSYIIPVSILHHKQSLRIVQMWHALGAIKGFGYQTLDKPAGNSRKTSEIMAMHCNYSKVICGSEATAAIYSNCFNVAPENIVPIGLPRVDYLLDIKNQARSRLIAQNLFPNLDNRRIILYAPTFRKSNVLPLEQLIKQIDFSRYTLIIKLHTLDASPLQTHVNVCKIHDEISILDLLPAVDYVITDYSATVFEAALLGKPLFFWSFDYEHYAQNCGFALDYYKEMPGLISKDPAEIIRAIEKNEFDSTRIRTFAKKYITYQDGSCTKRLVELLEIRNFE